MLFQGAGDSERGEVGAKEVQAGRGWSLASAKVKRSEAGSEFK